MLEIERFRPTIGFLFRVIPHLAAICLVTLFLGCSVKIRALRMSSSSVLNSDLFEPLNASSPVVALTSHLGGDALVGGTATTITWTATDVDGIRPDSISLYYSLDGEISWTLIAGGESNDGSYVWNSPAIDTARARIRVAAYDLLGNQGYGGSNSDFALDTTAPVFASSQMSVNSGVATTLSNYVSITFNVTDDAAKVNAYCLKYNSSVAPLAADPCWVAIAPTQNFAPNTNFRLGFAGGAYSVYAWAKNEAGLISSLTNAGAGTSEQDLDSVTFTPVPPPVLSGVTASSSDVAINLAAPLGSTVYIKWDASSAGTLTATPISIFYTTDDSNYTPIVANIANTQGAGCTLAGTETGCYTWTASSPTSSYYRIRVGALDTNGRLSYRSTSGLNVGTTLRELAGSTDPGTGGSAEAAVFTTQNSFGSSLFPQSFVVSTAGVVYFNDANRGLLRINPSTGIQELLVPRSGVITDGAVPGVATLRRPVRLALDSAGRVLIYDYDRIRRYDPALNTLTTIIGGGGSTAAVETPLAVQLPTISAAERVQLLFSTPDGKIYIQNVQAATLASAPAFRVYDPDAAAGAGEVSTLTFSGTGTAYSAGQDITLCTVDGIGASYDPVTSSLTSITLDLLHDTGPCPSVDNGRYRTFLAGSPLQVAAPYPGNVNYVSGRTIGGNGALYEFSRNDNRVYKLDPVTHSFSSILGNGNNGSCADGTLAANCPIDVSDVYADATGQIYYLERGRIRTIDQSGQVQTVMGSGFAAGDGSPATSARLGDVHDVQIWNDLGTDKIVFSDASQFRIREFALDGTIQTIAGNGSHGFPDTVNPAASQPISYNENSRINPVFIQVDPTSGTVYCAGRTVSRLSKIDRGSGLWEDIVGGGADLYYSATADTKAGNQINLYSSFIPYVIGFDGIGQLLVSKSRWLGTQSGDVFLKTYSTTTGVQAHVAGVTGPLGYTISGDGTPSASTQVSEIRMGATWDSFSSRWVFASEHSPYSIRTQTVGGAIGTVATLPNPAQSFAYRHDAGNNIIYYCNQDTRVLNKYNVTTTTNTVLNWPISTMACAGRGMIYSASRNSLIFPYQQNGIGGVAEYLNP